jgi:hypothetical protein
MTYLFHAMEFFSTGIQRTIMHWPYNIVVTKYSQDKPAKCLFANANKHLTLQRFLYSYANLLLRKTVNIP